MICGWDAGCLGMRLGGIRCLRVPAVEAYGSAGFDDWRIPPEVQYALVGHTIHSRPPRARGAYCYEWAHSI